jgi:hypothetical protein
LDQRGDHDRTDAERGGLGRPVQAHEKMGKAREADGTDQRKAGADEDQSRCNDVCQHG